MGKILKKIELFYKNTKSPYKWEWIVLAILILIPFVSCFYGDTQSIICYEANFFASIFDGDGILSFYDYCKMKSELGGVNGFGNLATYDFPMYIVLGIWGAPLWFFLGANGISATSSIWSMLYGKSILLVALGITVYLIYLICRQLNISKENAKWGAFLYASSLMVYVAICLNGQTDILGIVFILMGILAYLRNKKISFILFFAIAIPFKQYALFLFVPLMLLKEKKVWRILVHMIEVLSVLVVSNLLFDSSSPGILAKKSFELDIFTRLTANRLPILNGSVPVVAFVLMIICVYCYLKKLEKKEDFDKYTIFISLLVMGSVFSSFESSSYWFLHLAPYLAIMMVYNMTNIKQVMLFETLAIAALTLANYASRPWAFQIYFYNGMLMDKLFGNYNALEAPIMLEQLCGSLSLTKYCGILFGGYVVLLFSVIYLCRPSNIRLSEEKMPIRAYAAGRLLVNTAIAYIPMMLYLYNVYLANK